VMESETDISAGFFRVNHHNAHRIFADFVGGPLS
jgi:hypothetical protein